MTFATLKKKFPHIARSFERGKFFNPNLIEFSKTGFYLTTTTTTYSITCDTTYLGCIASSKETGKGNDLSDGENNEETWNDIVMDILSYELLFPD